MEWAIKSGSLFGMRFRMWAVLVSIASSACSATLREHLDAGRFEDAWATSCPRNGDEKPKTALQDRLRLQAELEARTSFELRGKAISGAEANARLGAKVLPDDVALAQLRVDVYEAPGSYVAFEPLGLSTPQVLGAWHGQALWKLSGLDPGSAPTITFSAAGLALDALLAVTTGGLSLMVDPNFRNVQRSGEYREGNASPAQTRALQMLGELDHPRVGDGEFGRNLDNFDTRLYANCEASLDQPCEWVVVLSLERGRSTGHIDTQPLIELEAQPEQLRWRWAFDHPAESHCQLVTETASKLPPGSSLAERINALFSEGPLRMGKAVHHGTTR